MQNVYDEGCKLFPHFYWLLVLITAVQLHLLKNGTYWQFSRYVFTLLVFHKVIESENISSWKGPIRITVFSETCPLLEKQHNLKCLRFSVSQMVWKWIYIQPWVSRINLTLEAAHVTLNQALSFGQMNSSKAPISILIEDFINLSTYMWIVTAEICTILSDVAQGSRKPVLSGKPDGVYIWDSVIKKMSLDTFV